MHYIITTRQQTPATLTLMHTHFTQNIAQSATTIRRRLCHRRRLSTQNSQREQKYTFPLNR